MKAGGEKIRKASELLDPLANTASQHVTNEDLKGACNTKGLKKAEIAKCNENFDKAIEDVCGNSPATQCRDSFVGIVADLNDTCATSNKDARLIAKCAYLSLDADYAKKWKRESVTVALADLKAKVAQAAAADAVKTDLKKICDNKAVTDKRACLKDLDLKYKDVAGNSKAIEQLKSDLTKVYLPSETTVTTSIADKLGWHFELELGYEHMTNSRAHLANGVEGAGRCNASGCAEDGADNIDHPTASGAGGSTAPSDGGSSSAGDSGHVDFYKLFGIRGNKTWILDGAYTLSAGVAGRLFVGNPTNVQLLGFTRVWLGSLEVGGAVGKIFENNLDLRLHGGFTFSHILRGGKEGKIPVGSEVEFQNPGLMVGVRLALSVGEKCVEGIGCLSGELGYELQPSSWNQEDVTGLGTYNGVGVDGRGFASIILKK